MSEKPHDELGCINCTDSPCHPHPLMASRCSRGTRGCDVDHDPERAAVSGERRPTATCTHCGLDRPIVETCADYKACAECARLLGWTIRPADLPPLTKRQEYARGWLDAYGPLTPGDPDSIGALSGLIAHVEQRRESAPDGPWTRIAHADLKKLRDELDAAREVVRDARKFGDCNGSCVTCANLGEACGRSELRKSIVTYDRAAADCAGPAKTETSGDADKATSAIASDVPVRSPEERPASTSADSSGKGSGDKHGGGR